jgi:VWFA-related protein
MKGMPDHLAGRNASRRTRFWLSPWLTLFVLANAQIAPSAFEQVKDRRSDRNLGHQIIRAEVRLVEISVIAFDNSGGPVADLNPADFAILESGREQEIAVFERHELHTAPPPPLPTGMVTNRLEMRGAPSGIASVVVLDRTVTDFEDAVYVRNQVVKFFQQIRTEDRVAILTLTRKGLRLIHDFTNDSHSLLQALDGLRPSAQVRQESTRQDAAAAMSLESLGVLKGLTEWLQGGQQRAVRFQYEQLTAFTAAAFLSIANYLARVPGRKNLIWVASQIHGVDPDRATYYPAMERAMRALNDASVALYPVDARGLVGPFDRAMTGPPPDFDIRSRRQLIGRDSIERYSPTMAFSRTQDVMVLLAQDTGGRHFINTNDIAGAIRTAIDESRVTYTLGYYPTHGKWDGSYREIQVKVKRPGVTIRHRRGYYAFPDPPATPETIEEAMLAAAVSPLDATAIGLTAQMTPHAANAGGEPREGAAGQRVTLTIEPEDVPLRLEDGRRKATLDVWYVLLDEEGAPHSIAKYPVEIALDEAGWRAAQATGIREERYMEFPAEARALRIVVRDRVTGVLGSLRMPLPQPN